MKRTLLTLTLTLVAVITARADDYAVPVHDLSIATKAVQDAAHFCDTIDNPTKIRTDREFLLSYARTFVMEDGFTGVDAELYMDFWVVEMQKLIRHGESH